MKKLLSTAIALAIVSTASAFCASAADDASASVYVTVSNKGELVAISQKVSVTDIDSDGALTVNDALYALHEDSYSGGASAGYSSYTGSYGLSLGMLWGDNSGNFGYCKNNTMCFSLADTVADGDYITAYIYSDTDNYSDMYTFFDVNELEAEQKSQITLTLSGLGYDDNWNSVTKPVEGAKITLNGIETDFVTDAQGKVTFSIEDCGECVISAKSDTQVIVPPVCLADIIETPDNNEVTSTNQTTALTQTQAQTTTATQAAATPNTGEETRTVQCAAFVLFCVLGVSAITVSAKLKNEK